MVSRERVEVGSAVIVMLAGMPVNEIVCAPRGENTGESFAPLTARKLRLAI
jgi:antitoxin (DNA-binding transcriptional repressor) of toxin-antitoxin stability system